MHHVQWLNNWLLLYAGDYRNDPLHGLIYCDHVVFSWPSMEDIRIIITLTLFISRPQFTLSLEAALLGFHGGRKLSSVPFVLSPGLALHLPLIFNFKAILSYCEFSLCKFCWVYCCPWLAVSSNFLSSSSWLTVAWGSVFIGCWVILMAHHCVRFNLYKLLGL